MKKSGWKKALAVMLGLVLSIQAPLRTVFWQLSAFAYPERSATVNASTLNVRSGPGTGNTSVAKLAKGASVTVINETTGSDGKTWYQIRFTGRSGSAQTGYVLGTYVKFPVSYTPSADFEASLAAQGFPDSYKEPLRQLHAQYPNWIFEAQQTGLDWNTVVVNESVLGRNLVAKSSISSYKSLVDGAYNWDNGTWTGFDGSTWVAASQEVISYYLDPRNFLDEVSVFQFMNHKYDAATQTREGLQAMVKGSFLEGNVILNGSGATSGGSGTVGGNTGGSPGGGPGVVASPGGRSGSSAPSAVLTAPQASISTHKTWQVTSAAGGVVVGVPPGSDAKAPGGGSGGTASGGSSSGTAPGGGSSGQTAPGGSQAIPGGGSSGMPGSSSSSPVVTVPVPGGGQAGPGSGTSNVPVNGTPGSTGGDTYVDIIMRAAQQTGLNPYVIASMIIQEQGSNGQGRSISGTVSGYAGYYNYFNVGAYAENGMSAVERGLWYASQSGDYGRPWNTPEKAIIGGAWFYMNNYPSNGQDTFYLKKFNVQGSNLFKHQYMTNVDGAASEASLFAEGYAQMLKTAPLRFKIPVYQNMPATPYPRPTGDGSPNNKLSGLSVAGFALTPTFSRDTTSYDLIVDHSVSSVTVSATAIDSRAQVTGGGTIQLAAGSNEIRIVVRAENGGERAYVIHVVRSSNGPTYNAGLGGGSSQGTQTVPGGSSQGTQTVPGGTAGGGPSGTPGGGPGSSGPAPGGASSPGGGMGGAPTPGGSNVIIITP